VHTTIVVEDVSLAVVFDLSIGGERVPLEVAQHGIAILRVLLLLLHGILLLLLLLLLLTTTKVSAEESGTQRRHVVGLQGAGSRLQRRIIRVPAASASWRHRSQ
jgi:hypothetical protein